MKRAKLKVLILIVFLISVTTLPYNLMSKNRFIEVQEEKFNIIA